MQKIIYFGQFEDSSGYGNAARNYLKCFDKFLNKYSSVVDFRIYSIKCEPRSCTTIEEDELLRKYRLNSIEEIQSFVDSGTKAVCHLLPDAIFGIKEVNLVHKKVGRKNFFSSMAWEPDVLPSKWVDIYKTKIDNYIVFCDFTKQCFINHGLKEENIHLVPHPIFDIESSDAYLLNRDVFSVFSMSQWNERKGWDILIPAFCHEFFKNEDVELVIKTFRNEHVGANPKLEQQAVINEIVKYKNRVTHYGERSKAKIKAICGLIDKSEISNLFKNSTVYCLPTRCDSFGLTIGEAVISKRTAIVPSLGGHRDYFSNDNPMLVRSKMLPCFMEGGIFSTIDMQLVETDYTDLRKKLRLAYEIWKKNPDLLAKQAEANYLFATKTINDEKIFNKFINAMGIES